MAPPSEALPPPDPPALPSPLGEEERRRLLQLARQAIATTVREDQVPQLHDPGGRLTIPAGVFVSLHKQQQLRGCIGHLAAHQPLYRAVIEAATSAALHDPRFPPLTREELSEVDIEISILSPMTELDSHTAEERIVIGQHGLMVSQGNYRGLLLPQVAVQFGWDARKFLEETCLKANLAPNAWCAGVRLEMFTAEVFGETSREAYSNST